MLLTFSNIINIIIRKDVILYHPHRQSKPIVENRSNRNHYLFINALYLWKLIPLKSKYKLKYRIMYLMLSIIDPIYLINISWISRWDSLYKVWTKSRKKSKFIVLQHGAAVGGIRTRYNSTKCDILLTWGDFFSEQYKTFNIGKNTNFITFGNPVYNLYARHKYFYKNKYTSKLLIAPSAIESNRVKYYYRFISTLMNLGFKVLIKEHNYQGRIKPPDYDYPPIEGIQKETLSLYEILQNNDYDFIISDHSTALLDIVYFKNKVIFFSPEGEIEEYTNNQYSKYLKNAYYCYNQFTKKEDVYGFIDLDAQESLIMSLIHNGSNILNDYIKES